MSIDLQERQPLLTAPARLVSSRPVMTAASGRDERHPCDGNRRDQADASPEQRASRFDQLRGNWSERLQWGSGDQLSSKTKLKLTVLREAAKRGRT